ncbi:MAG: ATP-binding protein [Syntrophales bacterium]
MTLDDLTTIIAEVQKLQSELDDLEVKAAQKGTPQRLFEALSAFSNRPGGGVLLLGLDESKRFENVGVGNAHRLQEEISHLAAAEMEPPLRPEFTVKDFEGKTVVVVEISEIPANRKPCYYKTAGLQKGAYIRVGNTNRQMTDYEIYGYASFRTQPTIDQEIVPDATLEDLDRNHLSQYVEELKRTRPQAGYLKQPFEKILEQLSIVREADGIFRPTLAGLLVFGNYPQAFEPQLVITFLQFYGVSETEKTPRGERFLDNKKFEGPIPEMVESAVNHVLAGIRKSSLIEGLLRRDIPEYPAVAIREALVNAVAHRDYSHFVRGSYIQIRLFADRLEIQSPGGLYGNVTEENLEVDQSTRNRWLMRLMEDLHLVENRGSGVSAMLEAMRQANLEPPRFRDRRSSFWVTFRSHTLLNPEAVAWLNRFAEKPMNDHQRMALVYLRHNEGMTNNDYQRLNHVDSVTATRELRNLTDYGLVDLHGSRRWAYYTLSLPDDAPLLDATLETDEEKILAYVRKHGSIKRSECQALLGVTELRARYILQKMRDNDLLKLKGTRKGSVYHLF